MFHVDFTRGLLIRYYRMRLCRLRYLGSKSQRYYSRRRAKSWFYEQQVLLLKSYPEASLSSLLDVH